ncbi:hypothetical protein FOZ62_003899 [Perkinsus olseni]|uniref:Ribokinase n=1 Tax=Perkinsus olseni TaxID=32597 RepID=A0A7J6Q790_PEROL|nr:hypothetical protein FOZ62_003899 [Perkinsus olseni]
MPTHCCDQDGSTLVTVVGSLSADFTFRCRLPRLPKPGETVSGDKFTQSWGGKGANQAVAAGTLLTTPDCDVPRVQMIGCVSADDGLGTAYRDHLKDTGVGADYLNLLPGTSTGVAGIVVSGAADAENNIVVVPGTNGMLTPDMIGRRSEVSQAIENSKVLVLQCEVPVDAVVESLKVASRSSNTLSLLNAAPAPVVPGQQLPREAFKMVDILVVNEEEAAALDHLLNGSNDSPADVTKDPTAAMALADRLLKTSGTKWLCIVSLGGAGCAYACTDGSSGALPCPSAPSDMDKYCTSTVGAGDCMVGSLAAMLAAGEKNPERLCKLSMSVATQAVFGCPSRSRGEPACTCNAPGKTHNAGMIHDRYPKLDRCAQEVQEVLSKVVN